MTYKLVQETLREAGIVISKKGDVHRVNFFGGLEDTARYTTSLKEALEKGLAMARPPRAIGVRELVAAKSPPRQALLRIAS